jgi:hypothetical protein
MRSLFQVHVLVVVVTALVGLFAGSRLIEPVILGALLGLGAGLGGGAFVAAIATGTNLAGGGNRSGPLGTPSIWDDEDQGDPPASNGHRR